MIFDLFTHCFGRFSAVARGALGAKPRFKGVLQPFVPLLVSYYGASELKSVKNVDFFAQPIRLSGDRLLIGLYVNELLSRVLGTYDPLEAVFQSYAQLITHLEKTDDIEPLLRRFEILLLSELGYGISFESEVTTGNKILAGDRYTFEVEHGFTLAEDSSANHSLPRREESQGFVFEGSHLLAISSNDFTQADVRTVAKRIIRLALQPLLGNKPLNSRILFAKK